MEFRFLAILIFSAYVVVVKVLRAHSATGSSDAHSATGSSDEAETDGELETGATLDSESECTSTCARRLPPKSLSLLAVPSLESLHWVESPLHSPEPSSSSEARSPRASQTSLVPVHSAPTSPLRSPVSADHSYESDTENDYLWVDGNLLPSSRPVGSPASPGLRPLPVSDGAAHGCVKGTAWHSPALDQYAASAGDVLRPSAFQDTVSSECLSTHSREKRQVSDSGPVNSPTPDTSERSPPPHSGPCVSAEELEQSIPEHPAKTLLVRDHEGNVHYRPAYPCPPLCMTNQLGKFSSSENRTDDSSPTTPVSGVRLFPTSTESPQIDSTDAYEEEIPRSRELEVGRLCGRLTIEDETAVDGGGVHEHPLEAERVSLSNNHRQLPKHSDHFVDCGETTAIGGDGEDLKETQRQTSSIEPFCRSHIPDSDDSGNMTATSGTGEGLNSEQRLNSSSEPCRRIHFPDRDDGGKTTTTHKAAEELPVAQCAASEKEPSCPLPQESLNSDEVSSSEPTNAKKALDVIRRPLSRLDFGKRASAGDFEQNTRKPGLSRLPSFRLGNLLTTSTSVTSIPELPASSPLSADHRSSSREKDTCKTISNMRSPPVSEAMLATWAATRRFLRPAKDALDKHTPAFRPPNLRDISSIFLASRSNKVTLADPDPEAHAGPNQEMEESRPRTDRLWTELAMYESVCTDETLQQTLKYLTFEFRDTIATMKEDACAPRPLFYRDPQSCQMLRPQMRCAVTTLFLGADDLVQLAKKAPLSRRLRTLDENQTRLIEGYVPTGAITKFTSLVTGRVFYLEKEEAYASESSMVTLKMKDRSGQHVLLEIDIVNCNHADADTLIHTKIRHLQAIKRFRRQSGLKIFGMVEASKLSAMQDIWMVQKTETQYDVTEPVYAVSPFVKVKRWWLTDLATLVAVLGEEAFQAEDPPRIYRMRLNLTLQILAVVCCLDTHGLLHGVIQLRHFALGENGLIFYLLPPSFEHSSQTESASGNAAPHRSRFALAKMVIELWCSSKVDYQALGMVSDWRLADRDHFVSCVPEMPEELKDLLVVLCSPRTVHLYQLLDNEFFRRLIHKGRHP